MLRSVRVGRLFGIPLFIHPTFLLLPAWVLWSHPGAGAGTMLFLLLWVLTVFGCVVLHELGHALTARHFGIRTRDITLYPIGGVARLEGMGEKPGQELLIALAGPAVNLVIALLLAPVALLGLFASPGEGLSFSLAAGPVAVAVTFLTLVWVSNVALLLFNLIPAFPMDGGRVLRALLSLGLGRLRATEIAAGVGIVLAGIIGAVALVSQSYMAVVLAGFVILSGQMELRGLRWQEARRLAHPALEPEPVRDARSLTLGAGGPAPRELNARFSGFTWHQDSRVWVEWRDGRPVGFWGPAQ
jgi:Zn-dependent protease